MKLCCSGLIKDELLLSYSAILVNEIDNFIEVLLLRIVNLLVTRQHRDKTMTIADCDSATVERPPQAIERAVSLRDGLTYNWYLSVRIDVPNVNETFCVTGGENRGVCGAPSCIVDVFLGALESVDRVSLGVRRPKFYGPVHGRR